MTVNVGAFDRAIRLIVGLVLLVAPFISGMALFQSGTATAISVLAGIVMIATAATRFCLLYRILGVKTCKV